MLIGRPTPWICHPSIMTRVRQCKWAHFWTNREQKHSNSKLIFLFQKIIPAFFIKFRIENSTSIPPSPFQSRWWRHNQDCIVVEISLQHDFFFCLSVKLVLFFCTWHGQETAISGVKSHPLRCGSVFNALLPAASQKQVHEPPRLIQSRCSTNRIRKATSTIIDGISTARHDWGITDTVNVRDWRFNESGLCSINS
jgi:hypothetical protein